MVAHNTIPHLFADRNADAVLVLPAFYHVHNQQTVPVRGSIFINILELPVAFKRWKSFHAKLLLFYPFTVKKGPHIAVAHVLNLSS